MFRKIHAMALCALLGSTSLWAQQPPKTGLILDDASYQSLPRRAVMMGTSRDALVLPMKASLKMYAPQVGSQNPLNTCGGWAFANALTIQEARQRGVMDAAKIQKLFYSPAYIYRLAQTTDNCDKGLNFSELIKAIQLQGILRNSDLLVSCPNLTEVKNCTPKAWKNILPVLQTFHDVVSADKDKTIYTQKALSEGNPVVVGIKGMGTSFFDLRQEVWNPLPNEPEVNPSMGHAICVVGYDDKKFGGAFEILNSYGTNWGSKGYAWIKYDDFEKYVKQEIEVPPLVKLPELPNTPPKPEPEKVFASKVLFLRINGDTMRMKSVKTAAQIKVDTGKRGSSSELIFSHFICKEVVRSGYSYQIRLDNNEAAYVYVFNFDSSNKLDTLFPSKHSKTSPFIGAKNCVILPGENAKITFDKQKGTDYTCILFCKEPLDMNLFKQKIEAGTGNLLERMEQNFGKELASLKEGQVQYGLGEGDLNLNSATKQKIVPLIVEFDHQ
jgi:Papain family cysteine protease/Domain of unknown function (DUF4384)